MSWFLWTGARPARSVRSFWSQLPTGVSPLELSARELGVLEVLMMRSGRVVSKEQFAEQLYGWDEEVGANAIEVYVHRLRRKLECGGVRILTVRGLGYTLEKPDLI